MMQPGMIKTARFGSGAVILNTRDPSGLSLDMIAARAPSLFAEGAHESRSERYTYIPTRDILAGLIREGFAPFEVRQGGSKDENKRAHTKHMVRLRHASAEPVAIRSTGAIVPEIILLNSHDGTSSYQLTAGAFRMVCTNGLIAGEAFDHVRVPHKGDVQSEVIDAAFRVVKEFPRVIDSAQEMAGTTINGRQLLAFATAARELRWEPEEVQGELRDVAPIPATDLLKSRRREDSNPDVWTGFNIVQENLMRGGQRYNLTDERGYVRQRRNVSEVRGMDQNRALNRALWTLAEEFQKLAGGSRAAA